MTAEQTRKAALAASLEAQAMAKRENAKHTPGPWEAKFTSGAGMSVHANVSKALGPRYSHDCPIYHTATDAVGLSIAYELWTQFPRAEWEAMQLANARLMAAAPEMLDALRIAREFMSIASDWNFHEAEINGEMRSTYDWLEVVDAAIAKATGDTQ